MTTPITMIVIYSSPESFSAPSHLSFAFVCDFLWVTKKGESGFCGFIWLLTAFEASG